MLSALRQKFLSTDLTARVKPAPLPADADPAGALDPTRSAQHRDELVQWAQGQLEGRPPPAGHAGQDAGSRAAGERPAASPGPLPAAAAAQQSRLPLDFDRSTGRTPSFRPFPDFGSAAHGPLAPLPRPEVGHPERGEHLHGDVARPLDQPPRPPHAASQPALSSAGLQVHNRYLITESEDGVEIIDQHALHERILYEQLREKVSAGALEKQRLLVPEPVSMSPAEAAAALEAKEVLAQLGIEIEPFGGDTILVSTYPAMLANFDPHEVLRQIVEQLMTGGNVPQRRDLLDEMLHMISCKAAVKAGDRLTPDEITSLLQQRHYYRDTHHCPHGRPTALVFTREELDKRFKRT